MAGVAPGVPAFCASTELLNSAPSNTADNTMNRSKRFKDISSVAGHMLFVSLKNARISRYLFGFGPFIRRIADFRN